MTTSPAQWLRDGGPTPAGSTQPVQADPYERVVKGTEAAAGSREKQIDAARGAWYRGFVAGRSAASPRPPRRWTPPAAPSRAITAGRQARWSATVEAPLAFDYHGHTS